MSETILAAYGTKHGSTREVACAVAETLRELGLDVDVEPAGSVDDLSPYAGVVLGGALYTGRWHPEALHFLERHRRALATMPVAVFGMGPRTLADARGRGLARAAREGPGQGAGGRSVRRGRLRRGRRPSHPAVPVQPDARERRARLGGDQGLGGRGGRGLRLRESRIECEGSPQRASADPPMRNEAAPAKLPTQGQSSFKRLGRDGREF